MRLSEILMFVIVGIFCAILLLLPFEPSVDSQQPKQPQPKQPGSNPGGGRVVELPVDKLPRFNKPIPQPPKHMPPERKGGSWHWHPSRGYLWFPQAQAPRTYVLEPTYRLPARVFYYQQPAASTITCPHCGNVVILQ